MLFRLWADSPHRPTRDFTLLAEATAGVYDDLDETHERDRTTAWG